MISPMRPRPMTQATSPSARFARRTPCSAIAPTVEVAASSREHPSGMRQTRLRLTETKSAWLACPAPAQATLSPTAKSVTSSPTRHHRAGQRIADVPALVDHFRDRQSRAFRWDHCNGRFGQHHAIFAGRRAIAKH